MMKPFLYTLSVILIIVANNSFSQNKLDAPSDSVNYKSGASNFACAYPTFSYPKNSCSFTVGYALPIGLYKSTSKPDAGYALGGFAAMVDYNHITYKSWGVNLNYGFVRNSLNTDAMSANNKTIIENQIGESIAYAKAKANNWFTSSLLVGPSYRYSSCLGGDVCSKFTMLFSLGVGASYVTSPATEYEAYIKGAIFETNSARTHNFSFAYNATAGISYKFQAKTSLTFNTSYFNTDVYGNNLKTVYIGNNNYSTKTYSFTQKITSLNFTIGLTTHF